jgi:CBS domain containing-hemolysin-like protein
MKKNGNSTMGDAVVDKSGKVDVPAETSTGFMSGIADWARSVFGSSRSRVTLRESLDEMIEQRDDADAPIGESEQTLIRNALEIRDSTVIDVMVPRVDIIAVEVEASFEETIELMTSSGHSRLPVYRDTLDDIVGMTHIKDVIVWRSKIDQFRLAEIQRKLLFVSPSMPVLELLLQMRAARSHLAIVVDEYGGVDGLLSIEDLVEEIVGEIEDEHDGVQELDFIKRSDGSYEADARVEVEVLEHTFGPFLDEEERDDIDTLGGLVSSLTGHVPIRGELITHFGGLEFQVLDADPRRVNRVLIRRVPAVKDARN